MDDQNENSVLQRLGGYDGVASCSGSSMDMSSAGGVLPSTSMESGNDAENGAWSEEQQDVTSNPTIFAYEDLTSTTNIAATTTTNNNNNAALMQDAMVDARLPSTGLINEGCTCYLNSLLQLLFHLGYFRNAVYRMPDEGDGDSCTIPGALKELFFHMQQRRGPGCTRNLTTAFGWTESELFIQHDIQEMATLLRDNLEERMKKTVAEGTINQLFEGYGEQVVETLDKSYVSRRRDTFYDIHLPLGPYVTLMESLRSLTAKEELVGDNKYSVDIPGRKPEYKDAEKSYEFRRFPPVIWFHLKRFEMNLMTPALDMKKVNNRLEFPVELCLQEFEKEGSSPNEEEVAKCPAAEDEEQKEQEGKNNNNNNNNNIKKNIQPGVATSQIAGAEEDEEEKEKKRNKEKESPFSINSPAVYDLQGVIVHRGSVRSGHYYCYIREWDPVRAEFTRWIEFDDDKVTVVSEDYAVSNNFGGGIMRQGRQCGLMATNNAYILSYVRRADCPKVLSPPPTDSIPRHLVEKYHREMLEERQRLKEEEEQRRKLTLIIFTDELLRKHVDQNQNETFPREMIAATALGIELKVRKMDTVQSVYEKIAALKELAELKLTTSGFRLWRCIPGRNVQTNKPFETYHSCENLLMRHYLGGNEEIHSTMTCIFVYIQRPTSLQPIPLKDPSNLLVEEDREKTPRRISYTGSLIQPIAIDSVTLCLEYTLYQPLRAVIYITLCDVHDRLQECFEEIVISENSNFRFQVNPESRLIRALRYVIEIPRIETGIQVREMRLRIPAAELQRIQPTAQHPGKLHLSEVSKCHVLVFFKYFNCVTCRVEYAGSAIVPLFARISQCISILQQLLGETEDPPRILLLLEERDSFIPLPRRHEVNGPLCIYHGAVFIGQREDIPPVCRYQTAMEYLITLRSSVPVHLIHIEFTKSMTMYARMPVNNNSNKNSISRGGCEEEEEVAGGGGGTAGRGGNMKGNSFSMELVSSTIDKEKDIYTTNFYPQREYHIVGIHKCVMNTEWNYAETCEFIASVSGYDPNYIRLYSADINISEQPPPRVDPAPSDMNVGNLLNGGGSQTLYFEVLDEPRRVVEHMLRVIVSVRTERNGHIYTERIIIPQNTSYGELLYGTLERCEKALKQGHCMTIMTTTTNNTTTSIDAVDHSKNNKNNDDDYDYDYDNHHEKNTIISSGDNNGSGSDNSGHDGNASTIFSFGSYYLILIVDVTPGIIRRIIEPSVTSDGRYTYTEPVSAENDPLTLFIVPAHPLKEDEFRLACCHNNPTADIIRAQLHVLEKPFVITVSTHITVAEAREELITYLGLSPSEVDSSRNSVSIIFRGGVHRLENGNERLYPLWKRAERSSDCTPALLLNHKRLRDGLGPRCLAPNNPALRISKK